MSESLLILTLMSLTGGIGIVVGSLVTLALRPRVAV